MTGRDLVSASLRLIGAIAPGESLDASEATDGLSALNRMIGSWSTENLLIYTTVREEFALTPGTAAYTMGSGATFNTSRPMSIERACIEVQGSSDTEVPLDILTASQWATIPDKATTSSIPSYLYPEGTYPNETLNLYPVPSEANKLVTYSRKPLTALATLDTAVSFPPGYEEALIYNFALRLAPEYGRAISEPVVIIANESKANIKRMNVKPLFLDVDDAMIGNIGSYDVITGNST